MKVAVIGGNGQLGSDAVQAFGRNGDTVLGLTHEDIEVSAFDSVSTMLKAIRPNLIVNTAASHHIEECGENASLAFAVNAIEPRNLGTIHATAEGSRSWYDFACESFSIAHLLVGIDVADPLEFPAKASCAACSVLNNAGLKACRLNGFGRWQSVLSNYLCRSFQAHK